MQFTSSHARTTLLTLAIAALSVGCDTPVNDVDLPPTVTEPAAPTTEESPVQEPVTSSEPDVMSAMDVSEPPEELDMATDDACEAAQVCLDYWVAYSDCSVVKVGPDGAIDPSVYTENCMANCELASRLDYVGHYACLAAGLPEDCAVGPITVPDCDI